MNKVAIRVNTHRKPTFDEISPDKEVNSGQDVVQTGVNQVTWVLGVKGVQPGDEVGFEGLELLAGGEEVLGRTEVVQWTGEVRRYDSFPPTPLTEQMSTRWQLRSLNLHQILVTHHTERQSFQQSYKSLISPCHITTSSQRS